MSILPLAVTYERTKAIDFSTSLTIDSHAIVYKYPSLEPDVAGFVKPFSLEVSHCIENVK